MPLETSQIQEADLEKTDRLPILDASAFEKELEHDDAAPMGFPAVAAGNSMVVGSGSQSEFVRAASLDLPALAESVRSVEERIARQNAEYESLTRAFERARETEATALANAKQLAAELAEVRAALELEQERTRDLDKSLLEKNNAAEIARVRSKEAQRELKRLQEETRVLGESLAARDASIAKALHSLGERDTQLSDLQREHAKLGPELEAVQKSKADADVRLQDAWTKIDALRLDLKAAQESTAALTEQVRRGESALAAAQRDLQDVRAQSTAYLETLRTHDWRQGFGQNMFLDLEAKVGAAQAGAGALESQRAQLQRQVDELSAKIAARDEAIEGLNGTLASNTAALNDSSAELQKLESNRAELSLQLAALTADKTRLERAVTARDTAIDEARAAAAIEAQRVSDLLKAADQKYLLQSTQIERLQTESATMQQEMSVLMAHLTEARRPIQIVEAEVQRLADELAAKNTRFEAVEEDNRKLRASLERTRGALEEREFLIRRLERSESNNANVLGRIQNTIERLGALPAAAQGAERADTELAAELIRVDGGTEVCHTLARRTRVGRAMGCELRIDSTSVSRHHALILVGPREGIIEDLNSTNGVYVNGRKVTRHLLRDGDSVTIGDAQFRFAAKPQLQQAG